MKTRTVFKAVVAALILLMPLGAAAKKKDPFAWERIAPDNWNIVEDSARQIFDAAMIFEKVTADDTKLSDDKCYRTIYRRIRILNEAGREWADVQVPNFYDDQKIEDIQGRTMLPDGTIIELQEDQIFKKEAVRVKRDKVDQYSFSLPGVSDDCIIEYMIKIRMPSYVKTWTFQKEIALLHAELRWLLWEVDISRDFLEYVDEYVTPNYLWLNTTKDPKVTKLPNIKETTELVFEIDSIPPFEDEPYSLPAASLKQKLHCYYGSNEAAASYWGKRATSIVDWATRFCKKNKKLKKVVKSFGTLETDQEKIDAAFYWLRDSILNVTYEDLYEDKPGKKPKKIDPKENKTADDMIKRGYGERVDIDYAFWDMLRELNVEANIAFAKDRDEDLFVPRAKYWQFSRSLVATPTSDADYNFYSPGTACTPSTHVPWFVEGVEALVGGGEKYIVPVRFSPSSLTTKTHTYKFTVSEDLDVTGKMDSRVTGHKARTLRMEIFDEEEAEFNDLMKEEFGEDFPDADMDSLEFSGIDSVTQPVVLSCILNYPALTEQAGRLLLKPFSYLSDSKNPFYATERKGPILFPYTYELKEAATFEIPAGWTVEALPSDTMYTGQAGKCGVAFVTFGNTISVQRSFELSVPFLVTGNYAIVKELYQTRQDLAEQIVVLKKDDES